MCNHFFFFFQKLNGTGEANFENIAKYPLAQLQAPVEELPEGVDPKMREVYQTLVKV